MTRGDGVWVLYADGWHRGTVEQEVNGLVYVEGERSSWWEPRFLDAMQTLHAATEAVTDACDAVVASAVALDAAWHGDESVAASAASAMRQLLADVASLSGAKSAEAEARTKLEALR
jgi:hypothetical protein